MTQWKNQLKNKTKLTGLWARSRATIQQVLISKFALGHEKLLRRSRNGPLVQRPSCSWQFYQGKECRDLLGGKKKYKDI